MSFRIRLLLSMAGVALVSLAVLSLGLRREVATRLSTDYERRVVASRSNPKRLCLACRRS